MQVLLQGNVIPILLQKCCFELFSNNISEYQVVDYVVIQVSRCMFAQIVTCMSYMQKFVPGKFVIISYCYHYKDVICFYLSLFSDRVTIGYNC